MADPLFGPEARLMLEKNETAAMKEFCESLHPVTVAEITPSAFRVTDATPLMGRVLTEADERPAAR